MNSPTIIAPSSQHFQEESGMMSPREARKAARAAAKNHPNGGSNPHFRRMHSPQREEDYYQDANDEPRSPVSNTGIALQNALPPQVHIQNAQRAIQINPQPQNPQQRRPSGSNIPPNVAGPQGPQTAKSLPPYPGPPPEDGAQLQRHRQNRRPEGRNPVSQGHRPSNGAEHSPPASGSPTRSAGSEGPGGGSPSRPTEIRPSTFNSPRTQAIMPPNVGGGDTGRNFASANHGVLSIERLSSPSINQSVLQPLEHKIQEYDNQMEEAQSSMMALDDEIRALQERRRTEESSFLEAKSKWEEYKRQHQDVGRALRGDFPVDRGGERGGRMGSMMQPLHGNQNQQFPNRMDQQQRLERVDTYDEGDGERPGSVQSGRSGRSVRTAKFKSWDRLRASIFGRD